MRYKRLLLVVLFLSLFVFQQAYASRAAPSFNNPSRINQAPASAPLDHIWVWVFHLNESTGALNDDPPIPCAWPGDTFYGCGTGDPQDPQNPHNPIYIDVEQYYLPDVLPLEMDVRELDPTLEALKAQAVAARTVASWKAITPGQWYGQEHYINNSTQYQVFIPGSYQSFTNPSDPAGVQQLITTAISFTTGQYLSAGDGHVIDAEFSSDIFGGETGDGHQSYLKPVSEPIGTCDPGAPGNGWGMSQRGAIRWSKGNQCAGGGNIPWPVMWTDYRQILAHYYTGVDFVGGNGAPNDRWNLLNINDNIPLQLSAGQIFTTDLQIQNTSAGTAGNWPADIVMGYQWTATDVHVARRTKRAEQWRRPNETIRENPAK